MAKQKSSSRKVEKKTESYETSLVLSLSPLQSSLSVSSDAKFVIGRLKELSDPCHISV